MVPDLHRVAQISMGGSSSVIRGTNGREYLLEEEQRGEEEVSRTINALDLPPLVRFAQSIIPFAPSIASLLPGDSGPCQGS